MLRLNEVGTRIWELFAKANTLDRVAATLVVEFETTKARALADVRAFVTELADKGLLVPARARQTRPGRVA